MNFDKLSEPPQPTQYIDWPEKKIIVLATPNTPLVREERDFWMTGMEGGELAGVDTNEEICRMMVYGLSTALTDSITVQRFAGRDRTVTAAAAGEAYFDSVTTVAFSRMWRELNPQNPHREHSPYGLFVVDFFTRHRSFSALHAVDGLLHKLLGIDRPERGEPQWFEGESVYLRVSAPAEPSQPARMKYRMMFGYSFNDELFTSIVPRLKSEAWPPSSS